MEKHSKAIQVYGYTVCVIAVITFLISISSAFNAIMDLTDPFHAGSLYNSKSQQLASFDIYKLETVKSLKGGEGASMAAYLPDDATLRSMYETARQEWLSTVRHQSVKSLTVSGIIVLVSIILFTTHWFWMRRLSKA